MVKRDEVQITYLYFSASDSRSDRPEGHLDVANVSWLGDYLRPGSCWAILHVSSYNLFGVASLCDCDAQAQPQPR